MSQPVKILVIEDHELLKEQIEALLSEFYIVKAVTHGEDGLRIAREDPPDLMICDIMLPDITGYDVLQQIRADQQLFNTPVILLTALEAEDNIIKGWDIGADDYITKPFKAKQLISRIDNLINIRRLLRQQHQVTFSSTSTKDPYLKKLYYFLENNLDNENLSVNDIATYMGGSISSTERQIKKLTSLSPVKAYYPFPA